MAKKSPLPPQKTGEGQEPGASKGVAGDTLFISMLQYNLEEQLKLIRGSLPSHVPASVFDRLMQKRVIYEELLEFIKTSKPHKRQFQYFVEEQMRLLQAKLSSASERDRQHLQYQMELYSKVLEPPHFGPPELDVFK